MLGVDSDVPVAVNGPAGMFGMWQNVWFPGAPIHVTQTVSPFPLDVVIDKDGVIRGYFREYLPQEIVRTVEGLLAGDGGTGVLDGRGGARLPEGRLRRSFGPGGTVLRWEWKKTPDRESGEASGALRLFGPQGGEIRLERLGVNAFRAPSLQRGVYFYRWQSASGRTAHKGRFVADP